MVLSEIADQLVESFKSTLDEVREADLLVHVVDISHESFEDHIDSVNQILQKLMRIKNLYFIFCVYISIVFFVNIEEEENSPLKIKRHMNI